MQGRSNKRQKELARLEKRKEKDAKKEEKKRDKEQKGPRTEGEEDPDIAGIIPGPQPPLEI
ncbi:MAG: hypothetical protein M3Y59_22490 [Myxococcota bacterium]|nr:hypothetical protein [Myxococcota bacterium]